MTLSQIVDFLNDTLKYDPDALSTLIRNRAGCNDALLNHPTIPCWTANETGTVPMVTTLGLLNGIASIDGTDLISVKVSELNKIECFAIVEGNRDAIQWTSPTGTEAATEPGATADEAGRLVS